MKNYYLFFLTIVYCSSTIGQISITQYDMPQAGDVYLYQIDAGLTNADFASTGSDFLWNFSQTGNILKDTLNIVSVTSAPLAYQLFFNNALLYPSYKANYAVRGDDFDGFGQVTIEDRYDFYKKNPSSLEIVGFGANINGIPASIRYDTIEKEYHFPMQYQDIDFSSGYFLTTIPNLGTYGSHIRRKVEVDGWGSVQTPEKLYPNALRVKVTLNITDTLHTDQFGMGFKVNRPTEIRYEWWTNEDRAPVLVATKIATQTTVRYLKAIALGMELMDQEVFKVIPSHQSTVFRIVGNEEVISSSNLVVLNVNGAEVPVKYDKNTGELQFMDETKGMYIVCMTTFNGSSYVIKLVK
jgi:hypothetical protein